MATTNFNGKCVTKTLQPDGNVSVGFETEPTEVLLKITPTIYVTVTMAVADLLVLGDSYVWSITTP